MVPNDLDLYVSLNIKFSLANLCNYTEALKGLRVCLLQKISLSFFPAFHARLLLLEYHTRFYGTRTQGYRYIDSCTPNETIIYLNIVCVRCIRNHTLINNNWLINILIMILRNFFVLTHFHMIVTFHICWSWKNTFIIGKIQSVIGYGNIFVSFEYDFM